MTKASVRPATKHDLNAICHIYNQGIKARIATFETNERNPSDLESWLERSQHPLLVAEKKSTVLGWIAASEYLSRDCYAGIAEFSIYIHADSRGQGIGSALIPAFFEACEAAGFWKILSRVFTENSASLALCKKHGFREVGVYKNHAKLDDKWRDVVIVEKLIEANLH